MAKRAGRVGGDGDLDGAVPGVAGLLGEGDGAAAVQLHLRGAGDEQVDVEAAALVRVDVAGNGGQEAGDVAGAAGAAEPGAALVLAGGLERVRVEERLAVERDAREEAVVERPLHHVDVAGVGVEQEQAVVPVVVADGGAGLVVGAHVGQLVVEAERLAARGGADAAGDVELAADDVLPDAVDGSHVAVVAGEGGDVGHARVHVGRAHGVADRLALLDDRFWCDWLYRRPCGLPSAPRTSSRKLGEVQVARVAGHAVELDEPHLGDLVAGPDAPLAGAEGAVEQVRRPERHVEERPLAGRLVVGDGGLVEVAEVVELVAVLLLAAPSAPCPPTGAGSRGRWCAWCRGSRPAPGRPRSWR